MISIKKKSWGIDTNCESCADERMGGYEITITICENCIKNGIDWKFLMKELKQEIKEMGEWIKKQ